MGNICGSSQTFNESPTHHRLGSASDSAPPPAAGTASRPPTQSKPPQSKPAPVNDTEERERRAKAAEERAKAAAGRGTNASNPKQGQLAAKINKPVPQSNQREEEPLRWD